MGVCKVIPALGLYLLEGFTWSDLDFANFPLLRLMSSSGTLFGGKGEKPESPASGNVSCQWRGAILAIVLIKRNQWARLKR